MRRLVYITIGFTTVMILYTSFVSNGFSWIIPVSVLYSLSLLSGLFFRNNRIRKLFRSVLIGTCAGILFSAVYHLVYLAPLNAYNNTEIQLRAAVEEYTEETEYGSAGNAWITLQGKPYRIRLYFDRSIQLTPGDSVEGTFLVKSTLASRKRSSAAYQSESIFLSGTQKSELIVIKKNHFDILGLPAIISEYASDSISKMFSPDTQAFAKALLLGNTSELTYDDDTSLKTSGIRHVVAVSGLHVSILFGVLVLISGLQSIRTTILSIPLLLFTAAVAGFTPSVNRACLMCFLLTLGRSELEEYDSLTSLAFSCLVMLVLNPFVWKSVSFQLSFASVSGIILFSSKIFGLMTQSIENSKSFFNSSIRGVAASVSLTMSSMVTTLPLSAYYFGAVSLAGLVTNLLTIWLIPFLFIGIGLACIIHVFSTGLAQILCIPIQIGIQYVLGVSHLIARFPFSAVYTCSPFITAWLVILYVCIISCVFLRNVKRRYPVVIAVSSLFLAIFCSVFVPRLDTIRLTVLDVGEGQSLILQAGNQCILIDCGGSSPELAANQASEMLLSQGFRKIDAAVLTHFDDDHAAGLEYLLSRIDVDNFFLPEIENNQFDRTISHISEGNIEWITQNTAFSFGNGKLTLLAPGQMKSANENCMCVLFESDDCAILITGDRGTSGEKALIRQNALPHVNLLVAGHHGSKNSTSRELLQVVQPEIVCISVGADNSYGHPAPEVLERLSEFHCDVKRTDLNGTIIFRR